jgi:phage head maturation protease
MKRTISEEQAAVIAATALANELGDEHDVRGLRHDAGQPTATFTLTDVMPDRRGWRFKITVEVQS